MNLEDFITNTIVDVITAIKTSQARLGESGIAAVINPIWRTRGLNEKNLQVIEFDIAVTGSTSDLSSAGGGAKAGIQVFGASAEASKQTKSEDSTVSRIKFSLPFIPPSTEIYDKE